MKTEKVTIYRNVFWERHHLKEDLIETTRFTIFKTLEEAIEDGKLNDRYEYTISYEVTKYLPE